MRGEGRAGQDSEWIRRGWDGMGWNGTAWDGMTTLRCRQAKENNFCESCTRFVFYFSAPARPLLLPFTSLLMASCIA